MYSVNAYGSNPNNKNDDCWYGVTFPTLAEAEYYYTHLPTEWDADPDVVWVQLAQGNPNVADVTTIRQMRIKTGAAPTDTDTWRHERAMEAGMLHGVNAYNDALGY